MLAGLPGFELGQELLEGSVLPLHHRPKTTKNPLGNVPGGISFLQVCAR